ncbi:hypothetical protein AVEN_226975-1 [Araneus ventricosus]|uniref:Uncharacterized protein n=1 Tax=Araneus ventricosus TaxID=182803 RepID=A0A4Y2IV76_ARAVE|nr:hypothetical protein AVEN_226975-1 [Araneus ventricosus]
MSQCDCPRARRCRRVYPVDPPAERSCQLQAQVSRIGVVKLSAKLGRHFSFTRFHEKTRKYVKETRLAFQLLCAPPNPDTRPRLPSSMLSAKFLLFFLIEYFE